MKWLLILSLFSLTAFAAQTDTDCPFMRESNRRSNPKASMNFAKSVTGEKSANTIKQ